jgi:regulation of enolase protein 1 (concanavalin A-like superfamily)
MEGFRLAAIPADLGWNLNPVDWAKEGENELSIRAGAKTDLFIDPKGGVKIDNAPAALFTPPTDEFIISARVKVGFASTFDAGALQVRIRDNLWAKLCFELSPQREPMIVSVVTHGVSDDCNSTPVKGDEVFLRIAQSARTTAFHYSMDGERWSFVRYFALGSNKGLRAGFSSQSPTGEGCRAFFSGITYRAGTLGDLRTGE